MVTHSTTIPEPIDAEREIRHIPALEVLGRQPITGPDAALANLQTIRRTDESLEAMLKLR